MISVWIAAASWAGDVRFTPMGYADVGWFAIGGDRVSYREYKQPGATTCPSEPPRDDPSGWRGCASWVFLGDPWSAPVDSQGEPADLGDGLQDVPRYDRIAEQSGFLVNAIEGGGRAVAGPFSAEAAVVVEPSDGSLGDLGDHVSLDRGWIRWTGLDGALRVEAGQVESSFGAEWADRRAPDRWTVTPSLIARYTTGTPVGIAARYDRPEVPVAVAASITNGDTFDERFGEIHDQERDPNGLPTGTLRVSAHSPRVEVGLSGEAGAQDGQADAIPMFQVGADLTLNLGRVWVVAEYLTVHDDLGDFREVDQVRADGGYVLARAQVGPVYPVVRVDRRVGTLWLVDEKHVYLGDVLRGTVGLGWMSNDAHVQAKAEWVGVAELNLPHLPFPRGVHDNLVTTSVVFAL